MPCIDTVYVSKIEGYYSYYGLFVAFFYNSDESRSDAKVRELMYKLKILAEKFFLVGKALVAGALKK